MKEHPIILNKPEEEYEAIKLRPVEPCLPGRKKDDEGQMESEVAYHQRFILQRLIPALISQARINQREELPFANLQWQEYRGKLFKGKKFADENFGDYANEMKNLAALQNDLLLIFLSQGPEFSFSQYLPSVLNHMPNNSGGLGAGAEDMRVVKSCLEEFERGARFLCDIVKKLEQEKLAPGVKRSLGTNVTADMHHKVDLFVIDENASTQEMAVNLLQSQITDLTPEKLAAYQAAHEDFALNLTRSAGSRNGYLGDQRSKLTKEIVKTRDVLKTNLFRDFVKAKFGDREDFSSEEIKQVEKEFLAQRFGPLATEIIDNYLAEAGDAEEEAITIIDGIVESKVAEFGEYYPYLVALSAVQEKDFSTHMLILQKLNFLSSAIDGGDIKKFGQLMKKWAVSYLQRFPVSEEIIEALYGPIEVQPDFVSKYAGYTFSFNSLVITRKQKVEKKLLTQKL